MPVRPCLVPAFALFATLSATLGAVKQPSTQPSAPLPQTAKALGHSDGLRALDGEWIYVEDVTEGRALEQMGPPMASKFSMRVEDAAGAGAAGGGGGGGGAVVLNGHGSGHKHVRIALDGTITQIDEPKTISRYRGSFKDGTFEYVVEFEREPGTASERSIRSIRRSFTPTAAGAEGGLGSGLLVRVVVDPPIVTESVARYQRAEDIAMPAPAKATIADIGWIAGDWLGTRPETGSSVEERWSPPKGGAMLATSRSVNTSGKMFAFEYLRIVERDAGLVYIAQPGGKAATEFVLTELGAHRAVFENPRHDYPKRIVYELVGEAGEAGEAGAGGEGEAKGGTLTTTIGYTKGGTPRRVELKPEGR